MESLRELYKVVNGPSSSHTMGPARAAKVFMGRYPEATSYEAVLYGSLAATGEGHLTDYIIIKTMDPKPVMRESLMNGLVAEGTLPGKLNYPRRAKQFFEQAKANPEDLSILIYAYALAVSEQNACGDVVVTAPTCGASGVLPGVLFALQEREGYSDEQLVDALAVAGLVGDLIKTNASISGAEVGCQGEVGSACSMAAAAVAFLKGASNLHCEYSAEIGLEHHLGMTCDPVYGYVQVPCIERNAVAAKRAYDAAKYAMLTDGYHTITLDQVMQTMKETGHDLMAKYRETAQGGLAKHFAEC